MKAKVVMQLVYEGPMDMAHDGGYNVLRLVIEEKDGLTITPDGDDLYAYTGFDISKAQDAKVLGEVEVDDSLVEQALGFAKIQEMFHAKKDTFKAMLKPYELACCPELRLFED